VHLSGAQVLTVTATDPHARADQDEHRRAIAKGDQDISGRIAAVYIAVLTHQMRAVSGDLVASGGEQAPSGAKFV